ncbi:MAG: hypothetical protein JST14_13830 [Bacteroidetes bacterium]|nr:hypothetical protein [Bacteroidota bacterium]
MTPEEENAIQKEKRVTSFMYGVLALIAILSLVYAFSQQASANKARLEAEQNRERAEHLADERNIEINKLQQELKLSRDSIILLKSLSASSGGR